MSATRLSPAADLVDEFQQLGGVLPDPVGACALELLPAIAAGQQADVECPGARGGPRRCH